MRVKISYTQHQTTLTKNIRCWVVKSGNKHERDSRPLTSSRNDSEDEWELVWRPAVTVSMKSFPRHMSLWLPRALHQGNNNQPISFFSYWRLDCFLHTFTKIITAAKVGRKLWAYVWPLEELSLTITVTGWLITKTQRHSQPAAGIGQWRGKEILLSSALSSAKGKDR